MIGFHPTTVAESFQKASEKAVEVLTAMSTVVDLGDRESLLKSASTSLNSKVCLRECFFLISFNFLLDCFAIFQSIGSHCSGRRSKGD